MAPVLLCLGLADLPSSILLQEVTGDAEREGQRGSDAAGRPVGSISGKAVHRFIGQRFWITSIVEPEEPDEPSMQVLVGYCRVLSPFAKHAEQCFKQFPRGSSVREASPPPMKEARSEAFSGAAWISIPRC